MHLKTITPKQAINKAYLREKVNRTDIELFKTNFTSLFDKINDKGDEEHLKSLIADFLKFTWYKDAFQINPIGKNDLVIHTGKSPADPIGVILEVKSVVNKAEMISAQNPNAKAIHELIFYYLQERISNNKHDLKQLIATNIFEWFVFDANEFDKKIYRNIAIKKLYEQKKADGKDNPWFYEEIRKLLDTQSISLEVTYFDIRHYKTPIKNSINNDDSKLIPLFKILSPVHLLKLSFANDSNTLQPKFYSELLHLIGLYEYKDGSKKLISRKKEGERNAGSLLENAIVNLENHDQISLLEKPTQYGETYQDRLYNVALELVITWINRILFLKLLEAQLSNYHKGDDNYKFLNKEKIKDFADLDKLFFQVLAKKPNERSEDIIKLFSKVPYLNSSLFEPTELERKTLYINGLENAKMLPLISTTVFKDRNDKARKGSLNTLDYLFEFLNAYDFSSEGAEEIQEDNKTLINASVLGLIFEKINGYKDGSFFTPGFITMYMCRETIRRALVQKFNEAKGWELKDYSELYDRIKDKKEANQIINSLKICDPAVGSGHFLVSALNEIITIKSDLKVLMSSDGRTLRDHHIEVVNDELIVTDDNGDLFKYNYLNPDSQTVQHALFYEKQTIIENCLFGVDINPNSVKICRLRLWIELLKNAYYKPAANGQSELETLPNIDINIKTGNSLISRFALDKDLKQLLKKNSKIQDYRNAIGRYQNAKSKEEKREVERFILDIKNEFRQEISSNNDDVKKLNKVEKEYNFKYESSQLFDVDLSKDQIRDKQKLTTEVEKLKTAIEDFKNNKIYENAFEWRFEFPEVLNNEGDFVGFDVVIGNPPYGVIIQKSILNVFQINLGIITSQTLNDSYFVFIALGNALNRQNGFLNFIIPNTWRLISVAKMFRDEFIKVGGLYKIDSYLAPVFTDAVVDCDIIFSEKKGNTSDIILNNNLNEITIKTNVLSKALLLEQISINSFLGELEYEILRKIRQNCINLDQIVLLKNGAKPYEVGKGVPKQTKEILDKKPYTQKLKLDETFVPLIGGSDFHRYIVKWNNNNFISYGPWLAAPRDKSIFEAKEKIIVRQTSDKLIATIVNAGFVMRDNTHILLTKNLKFELKYILALLNSRLFDFIYWTINPERGEALAQVKVMHLDQLPIKEITIEEQKAYVELVGEIINRKKQDAATLSLETQIDQLVYQLYNLTEEEIKIVEGSSNTKI